MSEASTQSTTPAGGGSASGTGKRRWATLGVVGVVVLLVVGGVVWHQSPTFCGALCHTPMSSYTDGYYSGDKALLVTGHAKAKKAIACLDCHESTLAEQLGEASKWITGDYVYPLERRDFATRQFCLKSGCHDDAKIVAETANYGGAKGYNPHNPRHGKLQCYQCHRMHGASSLFCNKCHQLKTPQGWVAPAKPGQTIP